MYYKKCKQYLFGCIVSIFLSITLYMYMYYTTYTSALPRPKLLHSNYNSDFTKWIIMELPGLAYISNVTNYNYYSKDYYIIILLNNTNYFYYRKRNNVIVMSKSALPVQLNITFPLYDSQSVRNLAVLYAIENGAGIIYETEYGGTIPVELLNANPQYYGLVDSGESSLFNPHLHFGLYSNSATLPKTKYVLREVSPYIQHCVTTEANVINSLWGELPQLVQSHSQYVHDSKSPPVFLSPDSFSPFINKNTIFRYESLWCMFLPAIDSSYYQHMFKSLICQRLMWEVGGTLGLYPPHNNNTKIWSMHIPEQPQKTLRSTVNFLKQWICDIRLTIFDCFVQLIKDLVDATFIIHENIELVKSWLGILHKLKYSQPVRSKLSPGSSWLNSNFVFCPSQEPHTKQYYYNSFLKICPALDVHELVSKVPSNIILIVVFNFPHHNNIPIIQLLHGQSFKSIIFCGSNMVKYQEDSRRLNISASFIEIDLNEGCYLQMCISQVMKMKHNVDGYLMIGDDVLINPWNIKSYPADKFWIVKPTRSILIESHYKRWTHWNSYQGRSAVKAMFSSLKNNYPSKYADFKMNLHSNIGVSESIVYGGGDIVYVPRILRDDSIFYFDLFYKYQIFMEIAFHTIVYGMTEKQNLFTLKDNHLWGFMRDLYVQFYNEKEFFIHPFKIGPILNTTKGASFFCKKYVPFLLVH